MTSLKAFGVTAVGALGVLVAGLLLSNTMKLGLDALFSGLLVVFVGAGALALVARSLR